MSHQDYRFLAVDREVGIHRPPRTYALIKRLFYSCLRPFYLAKSGEDLARANYLLFGVELALALSLLWAANPFGAYAFVSRKIRSILELASWLVGRSSPQSWESSPFLAAAVIYAICYTIGPVRNALAGLASAIALRFSGVLITAGESLLERRTLALSCSMGLLVLFTLGLTGLYLNYKSMSEERQLYQLWLESAESFMSRATLVNQERSLFWPVEQSWETLRSKEPPLSDHDPASLFQITLQHLYEAPASDPDRWVAKLRQEALAISKFAQVDEASALKWQGEEREWSLLFAFLARAHMRSVSDACKPVEELEKGFLYYGAVTSTELLSSRVNGLGTVASCRMILFLRASENGGGLAVPQWVPPACSSARECLEVALGSYEASAKDAEQCSFRDKRLRNNRLDLYLKMGRHFSASRRELNSATVNLGFASPRLFAQAVREQLEELILCTEQGEFVPATFLSAAQAYGVMSSILEPADPERQLALENAARYLRFAAAWLPGATDESDLSYFCSALGQGRIVDSAFSSSFSEALPGVRGFPEAELEDRLRRACEENEG